MASRTDQMPTFACPCLNVSIFPLSISSLAAEDGWQTVSIDETSIKIVCNHEPCSYGWLLIDPIWNFSHRSMSN